MRAHPPQIARSLRAFRNARKLAQLLYVRIISGAKACDSAKLQIGVEYPDAGITTLSLAHCTSDKCECDYLPVGTRKLHRLLFCDKRGRNTTY